MWSDDFCKLVEEYSARICHDLTNKYVHIRDMVSELKAYKAKPMKQVIPCMYDVGLDDDHSSASDDGLPVKRAKVEPFVSKQELPSVKEESIGGSKANTSQGLPALLCQSSSLCQFVPLSALPCSNSGDVDLNNCHMIDISADDIDSRSSFTDDGNSQPTTVANNSLVTDEVSKRTSVVTNSVDSAVSGSKRLFESVGEKSLLNPTSTSSEQGSSFANDRDETAKVTEEKSHSEPIAHCSETKSPKSSLASARHIKYLETLLSV